MTWLKKNWHALLTTASLLLNALGGAGIVPPVLGKALSTVSSAAQGK